MNLLCLFGVSLVDLPICFDLGSLCLLELLHLTSEDLDMHNNGHGLVIGNRLDIDIAIFFSVCAGPELGPCVMIYSCACARQSF